MLCKNCVAKMSYSKSSKHIIILLSKGSLKSAINSILKNSTCSIYNLDIIFSINLFDFFLID